MSWLCTGKSATKCESDATNASVATRLSRRKSAPQIADQNNAASNEWSQSMNSRSKKR